MHSRVAGSCTVHYIYESSTNCFSQRVRTLTEFRTMSVTPYPVFVYRDGKWNKISSDTLLPGDIISVTRQHHEHRKTDNKPKANGQESKETQKDKEGHSDETTIPADILLLHGQCIVNEAMLSGESTPLVKEGADLLIEEQQHGVALDVDGQHKGVVVFSGTKILQANGSTAGTSTECTGRSISLTFHVSSL
jgi:manganese-transporting P-type ATPase